MGLARADLLLGVVAIFYREEGRLRYRHCLQKHRLAAVSPGPEMWWGIRKKIEVSFDRLFPSCRPHRANEG
jgi:hypothetical protein